MAALGHDLVLFGGFADGAATGFEDRAEGHELDDTFTWNGVDWVPQHLEIRPSARSGHAMASYAGKVILFGGHGPDGFLGDTWLWNGHAWSKWEGAGPPARAAHGMSTTSKGVLVFAGFAATGVLDDTWLWDGGSWARQSPRLSPPARGGHTLASLGEKTLLLGGASAKYLQDAWQWDGSSWTQLHGDVESDACYGRAMATLDGAILAFGGYVGTKGGWGSYRFCDASIWDGSITKPAGQSASPSPREDYAMTSSGDHVVLFGGSEIPRNDRSDTNETWEWKDGTWTKRTPAHSPPPRREHAMAKVGRNVVMFGGETLYTDHDDTWEWDGQDWTARPTSKSPPPRHLHTMAAFDNKVLLFGGRSGLDPLEDTWVWDGEQWSLIALAIHPPGGPQTMVSLGDRIVLVATPWATAWGRASESSRVLLWQWTGERWKQIFSPDAPSFRRRSAITAALGGLLLFGGEGGPALQSPETWRWTNGIWSRYPTDEDGPKGVAGLAVVSDTAVLFDGTNTWTTAALRGCEK
jgi:hypothetical protein